MLSRKVLGGAGAAGVLAGAAIAVGLTSSGADAPSLAPTVTPIKHVVVIFDENISFDHYFGTYPNATNPAGEPAFTAAPGTPTINGLTAALLTANPNSGNPKRLDPKVPSDVITCDFNHGYGAEQQAFNGGLMNKFPENTSNGCANHTQEMNYYDGNTVTALWNYAQHYAMSDNSYGTGFGPSTIGAIHLVSGTTSGVVDDNDVAIANRAGVINNNTAYANGNPWKKYDDCSPGGGQYGFHGKNVGDLLSTAGVTWGWFQGGFKPSSVVGGVATCATAHANVSGASGQDYDAHHNPFAYYASTANQHHLPPSSTAAIGTNADQANHQYDVSDFDAALAAGNLPEVSFLKAGHYQDGHAGYSDPIDEQRWIVGRVNAIQSSPDWDSTAIVIAYDDSDGWYDHQASKIANSSAAPEDQLNGAGVCDHNNADPAPGSTRLDQCGPGPRLPLLVVSPYARQNFVDHTETTQSSILQFIEDNWSLGRIGGDSDDVTAGSMQGMFDFAGSTRAPKLTLDPATGLVGSGSAPPPGGGGGTRLRRGGGSTPPPGGGGTTVKPASVGKVKCTGKLKKRATKVTLTCTTQTATTATTAIRLRLYKGKKQLATASGKLAVKKKKLSIVLKSKKLKAGKYTLKVSIATVGLAARSQTLTVKI